MILKKNTATQHVYFNMISVVSGASAVTGATITAKRCIDGGSIATCTGSIVEDGLGMYHLVTSAADTNGNRIGFLFQSASGTYPVCINAETADGNGMWDVLTANHTTTGSVGKAVGDAASGITPNAIASAIWDKALTAIVTAGSIGKLIKDFLDVAISTRLSEANYTGAANGDIAAIKAKTDNLPGSPAATGDIPAVNAIADALLDRSAGVETGWTPRQALRVILAALAGKVSGAATSNVVIRDVGDAKNRISATVDANGNRTAVTYDKS